MKLLKHLDSLFSDRTLEGSIAFIVSALFFNSVFSHYLSVIEILPFVIAIALAEQLSPPNLDDLVIIALMSTLAVFYGHYYSNN